MGPPTARGGYGEGANVSVVKGGPGLAHATAGWWRTAVTVFIGVLVGILNGLLAVGGTLLVPASVHVLKMTQRKAHGSSLWVILPTSMVSLYVYQTRHGVDWGSAWKIAAGGAVGGLLGAWLMRYVSGLWLKRLFAVFMLIAAVRMAFG